MVADNLSPAGLYAGTDTGQIFYSRDDGDNWEILAEPIQTVMRRYGIERPDILGAMLDAAVAALIQVSDAAAAWRSMPGAGLRKADGGSVSPAS